MMCQRDNENTLTGKSINKCLKADKKNSPWGKYVNLAMVEQF